MQAKWFHVGCKGDSGRRETQKRSGQRHSKVFFTPTRRAWLSPESDRMLKILRGSGLERHLSPCRSTQSWVWPQLSERFQKPRQLPGRAAPGILGGAVRGPSLACQSPVPLQTGSAARKRTQEQGGGIEYTAHCAELLEAACVVENRWLLFLEVAGAKLAHATISKDEAATLFLPLSKSDAGGHGVERSPREFLRRRRRRQNLSSTRAEVEDRTPRRTHIFFSVLRTNDHHTHLRVAQGPDGSCLGCVAPLRILQVIHTQHVSSTAP